jgi:hypothetical protein
MVFTQSIRPSLLCRAPTFNIGQYLESGRELWQSFLTAPSSLSISVSRTVPRNHATTHTARAAIHKEGIDALISSGIEGRLGKPFKNLPVGFENGEGWRDVTAGDGSIGPK